MSNKYKEITDVFMSIWDKQDQAEMSFEIDKILKKLPSSKKIKLIRGIIHYGGGCWDNSNYSKTEINEAIDEAKDVFKKYNIEWE